MYKTTVSFLGKNISVLSNEKQFIRFVEYSSLKSIPIELQLNSVLTVQVIFNGINNGNIPLNDDNLKFNEYYGSEIFLKESSIKWHTDKLSITANRESDTVEINAKLNYRKDQIIRLLFSRNWEFVNNNYIYAHRFAIIYPLIEFKYPMWTLIHASAILDITTNRVTLFIGLNGVGKSTLAACLAKMDNFFLISDNYVITKGISVRAVPEMMRIPRDIPQDYDKSDYYGRANGKLLIRNRFITDDIFKIERTVILSRFRDYNSSELRKLSKNEMMNMVSNLGSYLKEYPQHHYTSFAADNRTVIDSNNIIALASKTKTFKFTIGNEEKPHIEFLRLIKS